MVARYSRRTLVGAGLGSIGVVLAGNYGWNQYRTRHQLRFWPLEVVNESDEAVTVDLTVEGTDREITDRVSLAPAGAENGDDTTRLHNYWMKYGDEWSVRADLGAHGLELTAREITDRLEDSGWGTDCAHLSIVVTADGGLESRVSPSDVC